MLAELTSLAAAFAAGATYYRGFGSNRVEHCKERHLDSERPVCNGETRLRSVTSSD